jgi:hypothetical protein
LAGLIDMGLIVGSSGSTVGSSVGLSGITNMGLIDMDAVQKTVAFWRDFVGMVLPVEVDETSVESSVECMMGLSVGLEVQSTTGSTLGSSFDSERYV